MKGSRIAVVPIIATLEPKGSKKGKEAMLEMKESIRSLLQHPSVFRSNGGIEGIILRRDEGEWLGQKWKVVRPDFVQGCSDHWCQQKMKKNIVDYAFREDYLNSCCDVAMVSGSSIPPEDTSAVKSKEAPVRSRRKQERQQREQELLMSQRRRRIPRCVMLMGLPGSGKSTFATQLKNHAGYLVANQDELGRAECIRVAHKTGRQCVVVDRCNTREKERRTWWEHLGQPKRGDTALVWFCAAQSTCVERVQQRQDHPVIPPHGNGHWIVQEMASQLEAPNHQERSQLYGHFEQLIASRVSGTARFRKKKKRRDDKLREKVILHYQAGEILTGCRLVEYDKKSDSTRELKPFRSLMGSCMVTDKRGLNREVVGAHVMPHDVNPFWQQSYEVPDINHLRNTMLICSNIENAFDNLQLTFIMTNKEEYSETRKFMLKVWDKTVYDTKLYDTGDFIRDDKGNVTTEEGEVVPFEGGGRIGDYDGTIFEVPKDKVPFTRLLSLHAQESYRHALEQGWITEEDEQRPEHFGSPLKNDELRTAEFVSWPESYQNKESLDPQIELEKAKIQANAEVEKERIRSEGEIEKTKLELAKLEIIEKAKLEADRTKGLVVALVALSALVAFCKR